MKMYYAFRDSAGNPCVTVANGQSTANLPLGPSLTIRNHSPTGFEWGYGGSGPAQLALAILLDVGGPEIAGQWYQHFKSEFVAKAPRDGFTVTEPQIEEWIAEQTKQALTNQ